MSEIKSLTHNGVLFQEPFKSKGFNKINNIEISLLAEEMLWKFSPYYFNEKYNTNKTFLKNVWTDLKKQLPKELQSINFPSDLEKLFLNMELVRANEKVEKAEYNRTHKKEIEREKLDKKEKYGYCYKNGVKTELSNVMCESSRWFISRGKYLGLWVSSVQPEDVEINASEDIPCIIEGHHWNCVELRDTDYIATYKINIGFGKAFVTKCVWLSANSQDKQDDTKEKYEHALELAKIWDKTYKRIIKDCTTEDKLTQENALISYLIFTYGIRIGNEKGENDFRDKTYGASTLLKKHVKIDNEKVTLSFVGKDSVAYLGTKKCHKEFTETMNYILKFRGTNDHIFKKANSSTVSEYLKEITKLDFISPKLARTQIGTITFAKGLQKRNWENLTDKEFRNNLMEVVLEVAKTLNHQKTISKEQSEKVDTVSKEKIKKAKETLKRLQESTDEKLLKIQNDKIKATNRGDKAKIKELKIKEKELKEKLELGKKKFADVKKEMEFKKESKEANLGTNLSSYSNPRLNYSLCKYANKDPSIIYSKTQLAKFKWAEDTNYEFWKKYPNI